MHYLTQIKNNDNVPQEIKKKIIRVFYEFLCNTWNR